MRWNYITLFSFVCIFSKAADELPPRPHPLYPLVPFSADIWIWEMPAALLSIRAADLTKQESRSMSPFVTCHWGTSWAAGTPSGVLGQEGVLQLPVSGRLPLVPCCPPGTSYPNVPSQLSGTIWPVIQPSGEKDTLRWLLWFHHPKEEVWWSGRPCGDRDLPGECKH